ncbi:white-brown-complex ABC transporter family, partial [Corchorus capsularis]
MEKPPLNSTTLARTKSDQLVETLAAAFKSPTQSDQAPGTSDSGGTLSRKSSRRLMMASPGRSSGGGKNTHIRKSRSAQMKLDMEELSSGAALSRASSASLGLSFSFTGFTVPPDEIADSKPFSDDDI